MKMSNGMQAVKQAAICMVKSKMYKELDELCSKLEAEASD